MEVSHDGRPNLPLQSPASSASFLHALAISISNARCASDSTRLAKRPHVSANSRYRLGVSIPTNGGFFKRSRLLRLTPQNNSQPKEHLLNKSIGIPLDLLDCGYNEFGERFAHRGHLPLFSRQYVGCLCSLPCCVKRRTQDARRFGIKGFIRKQGIHWLQFRRDHDLRLRPVAVATHVS